MKRQLFLLLASIFLFLSINAKGAEEVSSVYDGNASLFYGFRSAYIVKIDDNKGKDSFCSFEVDYSRGSFPLIVLNRKKQYGTLEQALSELDVILLRQMRRYSQDSVYLGKDSAMLNSQDKARLKEFTPEERAKIGSFLKGKLFDSDAASPKSSPDPFAKSTEDTSESDQKIENKVKITPKFVEVGGGTEERDFDWVSSPVKVSTAEATSDSEEELTFDWVVTPFSEKKIPDFAVSEEDVLKPFYDIGFSMDPRERLAEIIGAYDVLKDGKTITEEVEGQNEARFFIVYDGKRYLLSMRKVLPNKVSYVFVMDSLDAAFINEKGEIVRSNKTKEHVRIFENEPLYHKLEQFLESHQSRTKKN